MARKTTKKTSDPKTADPKDAGAQAVADTGAAQGAARDTQATGAQSPAQTAAPDSGAAPAGSDAGGKASASAPASDPHETADGEITVICHRSEGRRRAGRRWPHGETAVLEGELSDFELQTLRADPLFTVVGAEEAGE